MTPNEPRSDANPTAALDRLGDGLVAVDADWDVTYLTERGAALLGVDANASIGRNLWSQMPVDLPALEAACRDASASGEPRDAEVHPPGAEGRFVAVAHPSSTGVTVVFESSDAAGRSLLDRALDATPVGVLLFDADGNAVRANERAREAAGLDPGEDYETGDVDVYDEDGEFVPVDERPQARVRRTGDPVEGWVCRLDLPTEGLTWASMHASPVGAADTDRVLVTVEDITDRRERRERIAAEREDLRAELDEVLERVTSAFFAVDDEWRFTYVNETAADLLGVDGDAVLGRTVWSVFPEAEDTTFESAYREAMATQETASFVEYYEPLDTWFDVNAYPSESGLSVYFRDVTERERRERELERYEQIVETIHDGVYVVDEDGRFTFVNRRYAEMTGYDPERLLGSHVSLVVDEEKHREVRDIVEEIRDGDAELPTVEADLQTPDGPLAVEATFALLGGEAGRVGVVRDVTERRRRERELERQRDALRRHRANLERLVDISSLAQRVVREALAAESRAELESELCSRLVESPYYQAAWTADADGESGVAYRTGAGRDDATLRAAASAGTRAAVVARALREDSVQVRQDPIDPDGESDAAGTLDARSSITLPLSHESRTFGALTVHTDRADAFSGVERDVLEGVAETVGYALRTVEHRQQYRSMVVNVLDTAAEVGMAVVDADGTVVWFNEAMETYFDVDRSDVVGQDASSVARDSLGAATADPAVLVSQFGSARDESGSARAEVHVEAGGDRSDRWLEHRSEAVDEGLYAGGTVEIFSDVSGRATSERALAERERMWSTLVGNLPGAVYRCRTDPGWPMEFVSDGVADLTGHPAGALQSGDVSWEEDVIHPGDRESVREDVPTDRPGASFRTTYRITTRDDEVRWVWEQGTVVETVDGDRVVEGFITDVTDREWANRERDLTERLVRETSTAGSLDEALEVVVSEVCEETGWAHGEAWTADDGELTLAAATDRLESSAFLGVAEDATFEPGEGVVGRVYDSAEAGVYETAPSAGPPVYLRSDAAVSAGLSRAVGVPVTSEDGVVAVLVFYVREGAPTLERAAEAVRDVASRLGETLAYRRAETARRETEQRFEALVNAVDDYAIFALDPDGTVVTWNEGAERIKGYTADDIVGEHFSRFYVEEARAEGDPEENLARARSEGRAVDEGWRVRKDGRRFWARVVITPIRDDDGDLEGFAKVTWDMTERRERERTLERLTRVNRVVRRINQAFVEAESHDEIEQTVCDLIAETDPYVFAWYGEVDLAADGAIEPKTWAGREEGYLDAVSVTADASETGQGPGGTALRRGEVTVCADIESDESFGPWREAALERGYRSSIAVPVTYGEARYGLLSVYADRTGAFPAEDRSVFAELGESMGHAKNAIFRREGLLSNTVRQLDLRIESQISETELRSETSGDTEPSLDIESTVARSDGGLLHYVRTEGLSRASLDRFVENSPELTGYRPIGGEDADVFELHESGSGLATLMDSYGGRIETLTFDEGWNRVVVELPTTVDIRGFLAAVRERYPSATLGAQRTVTRDGDAHSLRDAVIDDLTDRQREAIETAFRAGYFSWPRDSDGEDISSTLDISPSTFHQHLRTAERKLLVNLFDD